MNEDMQAQDTTITADGESISGVEIGTLVNDPNGEITPNPTESPKTFTQEEVNNIVKERLAKQDARYFARYKVNDRAELDDKFSKAELFDQVNEKYLSLEKEHRELAQKLAFIDNNVNPAKQDDVLAYFKGKELDFTSDNLKAELQTHPEWLNVVAQEEPKATIKVMGNDTTAETPQKSDEEIAAKLFGFNKFAK